MEFQLGRFISSSDPNTPSKLPLNEVSLQDAKVAYDTVYEVIVAV